MKKILCFTCALFIFTIGATQMDAQCTQYDPNSIYVDFEDDLPCGATCGTPTVSGFEIYSNEAYILGTLKAGSEYVFTLGTPSGAGWTPTMTVAAWNGTAVGAVVGFVDGRTLNITIPSDGDYIIIISVTGACNGAATNAIDNGTLSIDCGTGGATCSCTPTITYTAAYNCATGNVDMNVTAVLATETPYTVTIGGVVQSVSTTGMVSFSGVSNNTSVDMSISSATSCVAERIFAATGCSSANCSSPTNLVVDGGFEGAGWTEVSTVDGNPSGFGIADASRPLVGTQSAWLGGFADTSVTSVSQSITIPNGDSVTLSFWFLGSCDSPNDYFAIYVDGNPELSFDGTGTFCGDGTWHKVNFDLSQFADGSAHTIMVQANTFATNGNGSNFFIDELMIESCSNVTVGVNSIKANEIRTSISPNPASHISTLAVEMDKASDVQVEIVSITGQVVYQTILLNTANIAHPLDLQNLSNGVYLVHITSGNHSAVEKLIISK